jgi:hypothetical protein
MLNQRALIAAQRGLQGPQSHEVYANNPNAYINHVRDNGFVERYDVARREPSVYRRVRRSAASPSSTPTTTSATMMAPPTPTLPLASFYNAESELVWPAEAPTAGDLKAKRAIFDEASKAVFDETKKSGVASIATVTDARKKLIEYGRPGLQYARAHDTPRIADTYHLFLLSLYESLAQAVNPPAPGAAAATQPATPTS